MKDIFIQIREKVVSRMKYIPSFPIDYNAITVFIGFDRVDQLGQPIQREVDRKNTDYIIFGGPGAVPNRWRSGYRWTKARGKDDSSGRHSFLLRSGTNFFDSNRISGRFVW